MFTVVLCLALTAPAAEPKLLLDELTTVGLDIPGTPRHKLPQPTLDISMSADKIKAAVAKLGEEYEGTEHNFTARSRYARYPMKLEQIEDKDGKRIGHSINVWFVAYGNIKELDSENMLEDLMGVRGKAKKVNYLEDAELKERKITPTTGKDLTERFALMDTVLVEKIKLTGVLRSQKRWVNGSLITAMTMDERFANDAKSPNRWQKDEGDGGAPVWSKPYLYKGFGGYVKATPLPDTKDGIVIEMHFAVAEPEDWFDGKNILGSKLRTGITNNVQSIRDRLKKRR